MKDKKEKPLEKMKKSQLIEEVKKYKALYNLENDSYIRNDERLETLYQKQKQLNRQYEDNLACLSDILWEYSHKKIDEVTDLRRLGVYHCARIIGHYVTPLKLSKQETNKLEETLKESFDKVFYG